MKLTDLQEKWLQELESGKHQQGTGKLRLNGRYCCLGIAEKFVFHREFGDGCLIINNVHTSNDSVMCVKDYKRLGLYEDNGELNLDSELKYKFYGALKESGYVGPQVHSLASYNDRMATFKQIAFAIRKIPEAVFTVIS